MIVPRRTRLLTLLVAVLTTLTLAVPLAHASATAGKPVEPPAKDPFNDRLSVTVGTDGRFSEGAFPDPETGGATTGSFKTLYGWPSTGTSFTTVRVDGSDAVYGSDAGSFLQPPADVDPTTDESVWRVGDISIKQQIKLVTNVLTGRPDTAQISYTLTNNGPASHDVGTRVMLDTDVNDNDGAPFRVPTVGTVTTEHDLTGQAIPDSFTVFYDLADSQHIAAAVLRGASATPPDRLVIAAWPSIFDTQWDYTVDPARAITSDSAYATYWNPAPLPPGGSRTYTTYYGLADVTVDLTPPLALGLSGPAALTADGQAYSPNPFTVTATVANSGTVTATDVRLTLNLPAGLHTSDPTTVAIGDLAAGGPEHPVTWSVRADPAAAATTRTYSVTATAGNGVEAKTLSRDIFLPGILQPHYVALGDSYSSGEGNPPFDTRSNVPGDRCHRSADAWPRLLGVKRAEHLACSGAKIKHVLDEGQASREPDNVPQVRRLRGINRRAPVSVVTISIGGNDLGFADILGDCFVGTCLRHLSDDYRKIDRIARKLEREVYPALRQVAPDAQVIVVGYPRLFPRSIRDTVRCGWLTPHELTNLNRAQDRLDRKLREAADAAGVAYVSVLDALDGHELCTRDSWMYPVGLHGGQLRGHPLAPGQRAIAAVVAAHSNGLLVLLPEF